MQATRIGPMKLLIRSVDMSKLAPRVHAAMEGAAPSLRDEMLSIARDFELKI